MSVIEATARVAQSMVEEGKAILERRQKLGLSRAGLARLSGLTAAKIWRVEDGRPQPDELATLDKTLTEAETNGLPEDMKPRKRAGGSVKADQLAALIQRLQSVDSLIVQALEARSRKEANEFLSEAQQVIAGKTGEAESATTEVSDDAEKTDTDTETGQPEGANGE